MLILGDPTTTQVIKYVALGDSLTAGAGTQNYQDSLPFLVGANLVKTGVRVEVVNLALSGVGVKQVLNEQVPRAILEKPDFITLLIGINDIHNLVPPDSFRKDYSKIISLLTARTRAKIIVINIPYLGSDRILLPPYNALLDSKTKLFNDVIKKEVKDKDIRHVDLYKQTAELFKKASNLYSEDQFHPSKEGYLLWGKIINAN